MQELKEGDWVEIGDVPPDFMVGDILPGTYKVDHLHEDGKQIGVLVLITTQEGEECECGKTGTHEELVYFDKEELAEFRLQAVRTSHREAAEAIAEWLYEDHDPEDTTKAFEESGPPTWPADLNDGVADGVRFERLEPYDTFDEEYSWEQHDVLFEITAEGITTAWWWSAFFEDRESDFELHSLPRMPNDRQLQMLRRERMAYSLMLVQLRDDLAGQRQALLERMNFAEQVEESRAQRSMVREQEQQEEEVCIDDLLGPL